MSWGNKNFITPLRLLQAASERTAQLPFIPRFLNVYTSSKLEYMWGIYTLHILTLPFSPHSSLCFYIEEFGGKGE